MDGKESTTPQKPRFFVSKAPPPINPVGPTVRLPRPKPLQMPIHLPPDYPDELKQLTRKIIVEAIKEFLVDTQITRQTQITKVCKRVVSKLTPKLCAVVGDEVLSVMDKLLHYFLVVNCGELERDQVRQETIESGEWTNLTKEMVRAPLAGRPQSQPVETTGHKGAKHAKEQKQGKPFKIGSEVHSLIPRYRKGLTCLRKAKADHPSAEHIWKGELRQNGFSDIEVVVVMISKTPESAACRIVARKHPDMELKTVQNHYSAFKDS